MLDQWEYIVGVGCVLALIIGSIFTIILCRCYQRKKFGIHRRIVEVQVRCALSSTLVRQGTILDQNKFEAESPIYYEAADVFHIQLNRQRSETGETVRPELDTSMNSENISEEEYCYPKNTNQYENVSRVPEANEEYSCAYDYLNVNTDYMNTFPREQEDDRTHEGYEYPQNNRNSSPCEYRYAYDWWLPLFKDKALRPSKSEPTLQHTSVDKDKMADNFHNNHYENHQILSQETGEEDNKTEHLEYVKVL